MSRVQSYKIRRAFYDVQHGKCFYCNNKMKFKCSSDSLNSNESFTIDHVIPVDKKGHVHKISNMIGSCRKCNAEKANNYIDLSYEEKRRMKLIQNSVSDVLLGYIIKHLSFKVKPIVIPVINESHINILIEKYNYNGIFAIYTGRGEIHGYHLRHDCENAYS